MNTITNKECVQFTVGILQTLKENGFHVSNIREAFTCVKAIVEAQVELEFESELQRSKEDECLN